MSSDDFDLIAQRANQDIDDLRDAFAVVVKGSSNTVNSHNKLDASDEVRLNALIDKIVTDLWELLGNLPRLKTVSSNVPSLPSFWRDETFASRIPFGPKEKTSSVLQRLDRHI